ncbi:toll/interleukin-1 receptor domain-containing protein [Sorangium sp. So ce117]|uniref:toll/interleukin-1 receptor domain-containing protein n=1 Tax=Sorangium sp. So ce117 TaxID=3133277 RepID=UPI003F637EC3
MTYRIELLSVGCDLDAEIQGAAAALNAVQSEFLFELPPPRLKNWGKPHVCKDDDCLAADVFALMRSYRKEARGNRPHIIAFVNAPLRTKRLRNLFGATASSAGLAVVTRHDADRFAPSVRSYFVYYLTRYALSFMAPNLKNHEETRDCFLDQKISKYDLRRSMAIGALCDECQSRFDERANAEIRVAFTAMAREVARLGFAASADAITARSDHAARAANRDTPPLDAGRKEPPTRSSKCRLFFSYSHADASAHERLEAHIKVLWRKGFIEPWHARRIPAGADWGNEIDRHLDEAEIILLLVSADFLASDYCWEVEMTRALKRHDDGRAVVVSVILKPCLWREAPFAKLQPLPKNGCPITRWTDPDDAWLDVAEGIRNLVTISPMS